VTQAIETSQGTMLRVLNRLDHEFWSTNVRHLDEQHQRRAELPTDENQLNTNSRPLVPVIAAIITKKPMLANRDRVTRP
jgi:hypothetical protein